MLKHVIPAKAGIQRPRVFIEQREQTMEMFTGVLTIFVLAVFVGIEVITKVPPTLHTPLMSGSNAISGITLIGAVISAGSQHTLLTTALATVAFPRLSELAATDTPKLRRRIGQLRLRVVQQRIRGSDTEAAARERYEIRQYPDAYRRALGRE